LYQFLHRPANAVKHNRLLRNGRYNGHGGEGHQSVRIACCEGESEDMDARYAEIDRETVLKQADEKNAAACKKCGLMK